MGVSSRLQTVLLVSILSLLAVASAGLVFSSDDSYAEGDYPQSETDLTDVQQLSGTPYATTNYSVTYTGSGTGHIGKYDTTRTFIIIQNTEYDTGYLKIENAVTGTVQSFEIYKNDYNVIVELVWDTTLTYDQSIVVIPYAGSISMVGAYTSGEGIEYDSFVKLGSYYFRFSKADPAAGNAELSYNSGILSFTEGTLTRYDGSTTAELTPTNEPALVHFAEEFLTVETGSATGMTPILAFGDGTDTVANVSVADGRGTVVFRPGQADNLFTISNTPGMTFSATIKTDSNLDMAFSNDGLPTSRSSDFVVSFDSIDANVAKVTSGSMVITTTGVAGFEIMPTTYLVLSNSDASCAIASADSTNEVVGTYNATEHSVTITRGKFVTFDDTSLRIGLLTVETANSPSADRATLEGAVILDYMDSVLEITHPTAESSVTAALTRSPTSISHITSAEAGLNYTIAQDLSVTMRSGSIRVDIDASKNWTPFTLKADDVSVMAVNLGGSDAYNAAFSYSGTSGDPIVLLSGTIATNRDPLAGAYSVRVGDYTVSVESGSPLFEKDATEYQVILSVGTMVNVGDLLLYNSSEAPAYFVTTDLGYLKATSGVPEITLTGTSGKIGLAAGGTLTIANKDFMIGPNGDLVFELTTEGTRAVMTDQSLSVSPSGEPGQRDSFMGAECEIMFPDGLDRTMVLYSGTVEIFPNGEGYIVSTFSGDLLTSPSYTITSYDIKIEHVDGLPKMHLGGIILTPGQSAILGGATLTASTSNWTVTAESVSKSVLTLTYGEMYSISGSPFSVSTASSSGSTYELTLLDGDLCLSDSLNGGTLCTISLGSGQKLRLYADDPASARPGVVAQDTSVSLNLNETNLVFTAGTISMASNQTIYAGGNLFDILMDDTILEFDSVLILIEGSISSGSNFTAECSNHSFAVPGGTTLTMDNDVFSLVLENIVGSVSMDSVSYILGVLDVAPATAVTLGLVNGYLMFPLAGGTIPNYYLTTAAGAVPGFTSPGDDPMAFVSVDQATFNITSQTVLLSSGTITVPTGSVLMLGSDALLFGNGDVNITAPVAAGDPYSLTVPANITASTANSSGPIASYSAGASPETVSVTEDGTFSGSYTITNGTSQTITGITFTAVGGDATMSLVNGVPNLESGAVSFDSATIYVNGTVSVATTGTGITVSSDGEILLNTGDSISVSNAQSATPNTFTATASCTVRYNDSLRISIAEGSYTLTTGEIVFFGDMQILGEATAELSYVGGELTLTSGTISTRSDVTVTVNSIRVILPAGIMVAAGSSPFSVYVPCAANTSFQIENGSTATSVTLTPGAGADPAASYEVKIVSSSEIRLPLASVSGNYVADIGNGLSVRFFSAVAESGPTLTAVIPTVLEVGTNVVLGTGSVELDNGSTIYLNDTAYITNNGPGTLGIQNVDSTVSITVKAGSSVETNRETYTAGNTDVNVGVDQEGYLEATYQIPAGTSKDILGTTFTAIEDATLTRTAGVTTLVSGAVSFSQSEIKTGAVKVSTTSSTSITVSAGKQVTLSANQNVILDNGTDSRTYNSVGDCVLGYADDLMLTVIDGTVSLNQGSVVIGTKTYSVLTDATNITFDQSTGVFSLELGSITCAESYSFTFGGKTVQVEGGVTAEAVNAKNLVLRLPDIAGTVTLGGVAYTLTKNSSDGIVPIELTYDSALLSFPATVTGSSGYTLSAGADGRMAFIIDDNTSTSMISSSAVFNVLPGKPILTSGSINTLNPFWIYVSETVKVQGDDGYTISPSSSQQGKFNVVLSAGITVTTTDSQGQIDSYTAAGSEMVLLGTDGYFSKSYLLNTGDSVQIKGNTYTATVDSTRLSLNGGNLTLTTGSILLPANLVIITDGLTYTNTSNSDIEVSADRSVVLDAAESVRVSNGTGVKEFTATADCKVKFGADLSETLLDGSITVPAGGSIRIAGIVFRAINESVLGYDGTTVTLASGKAEAESAATIVAGGYTFVISDGYGASVNVGASVDFQLKTGSVSVDGTAIEQKGQNPIAVMPNGSGKFSVATENGISFAYLGNTYTFTYNDAEQRTVSLDSGVLTANISDFVGQDTKTMNVAVSGACGVKLVHQTGQKTFDLTFGGDFVIEVARYLAIDTTSGVTIASGTLSSTYSAGSTGPYSLVYDFDTGITKISNGSVRLDPGNTIKCDTSMILCNLGSLVISHDGNLHADAGSKFLLAQDNEEYTLVSTSAADITLTQLFTDLEKYNDFYADVYNVLETNPYGIPDIQPYLDRMDALVYDVSLGYDANKDRIDEIYDEYQSIGRDDNESIFQSYKEELIAGLKALHSAGECQAVSNRIDECVTAVTETYYDGTISYMSNLHRLDPYALDVITAEISALNDLSFSEYKNGILTEIDALHEGETCIQEVNLVNNAYGLAQQAQYDPAKSFDDNRKVVDKILADCKQGLTVYRDDSDSFNIYKTVKIRYLSTQDTFESEEVVKLIESYSEKIRALNHNPNKTLDDNFVRVDDIVSAFDAEVAKIGAAKFGSFKDKVLADMNGLLATYADPDVKELINKAVFEVKNYFYDSTVSYKDNTNRLTDIQRTLDGEIQRSMSSLISKFDSYRQQYLDLFNDRKADPQYVAEEYQAEFAKAIQDMTQLEYDHSLNLKSNEERADSIALTLQENLYKIGSQQVLAEFSKFKADAIRYVTQKVISGSTDAIDALVDEYKNKIKAVEYDPAKTAEENDAAVRNLITEFEQKLEVLVQRANFDRVVDAGVDYLVDRYGSYDSLSDLLDADIIALRAVPYDDTLTLEENQKVIETMVNEFSVELFKLRQKSIRGDYDNYRDYVLWEIGRLVPENSPENIKSLADEYSKKVKAADFDETSYLYNKNVVYRIYTEYVSKVAPLLVDYYRGHYISELKAQADGSSAVGDAISKGETAIRKYVSVNDLETDISRLTELKADALVSIGYAKAQADEASFNAYANSRLDLIKAIDTDNERIALLKEAAIAAISEALASGKSLSEKSQIIGKADRDFFAEYVFLAHVQSRSDAAYKEHIFGESKAASGIIDNFVLAMDLQVFSAYSSLYEAIDAVDKLYTKFSEDLNQRRLLDNSTVSGELNADGTSATTGGAAEYPEGSDEVWGIVANTKGMGDNSSVVFKKVETETDPYGKRTTNAEGSTVSVLSDGKVLGAFDVTLYNSGQQVSSFAGSYVVKILLPADMRGYDRMQVAYVDEFGDVQVYDAEVQGNFLVYTTTHFSTFMVIGVNPEVYTYYDVYLYAAVAVVILIIFLWMSHVVVFQPQGGNGKKVYAYSFGTPEGRLDNPFQNDGRRLAGWHRAGSEEIIPVGADVSEIGKFRFARLTAVWEDENDGGEQ